MSLYAFAIVTLITIALSTLLFIALGISQGHAIIAGVCIGLFVGIALHDPDRW